MRKVLRHLLRPLAKSVAFGLIVPVLWLIEPFWKIRLTHLWSARFGPLCFTTHTWVVRRKLEGPERRTARIFFGAKPVNRQLWTLWRRVLPIVESRALSAFYHYAGPGLARTRFFKPLPEEYEDHFLVNHSSGVAFSPDEERRGRALLEEMGLGEGEWFVAFQARDSSYHAARGAPNDSGAHRNCDLASFLPAARHISAEGGFAVRLGSAATTALPDMGDPRIVDYACRHRSDFGDVWLSARCRFYLGCSSGAAFCPILFNRPVAMANMMPLRPVPSGRMGLYTPVIIREKATGRMLTFGECEALGAFDYDTPAMKARWQYPGGMEACGLEIVTNTAEQVLDLCKDMFDRLGGRPPTPEIAEMQAWYKRRFFAHVPTIADGPDIAPSFIRKYPQLFED